MVLQHKFVFTPTEAASVGVTESKDLPKLIEYANKLVRAPISKVKFGVVGLVSSGRILLGVNIEFPGLPLHYSISAEKFLFANLALNSEYRLLEYHIPNRCGPESFKDEVLMLLSPRNNYLALSDPDLAGDICSDPGHCSQLKCRALAAATRSFALFSDCPSGVALVDSARRVYQGWYVESVGYYNLTLGPVQAALVDFVARGEGKGFDKIVGAVLVEKKDAKVRQEDTSRLLIKKIAAPNCDFNVFHCN